MRQFFLNLLKFCWGAQERVHFAISARYGTGRPYLNLTFLRREPVTCGSFQFINRGFGTTSKRKIYGFSAYLESHRPCSVRKEPSVRIPVLPSITLLKAFCWNERKQEIKNRDKHFCNPQKFLLALVLPRGHASTTLERDDAWETAPNQSEPGCAALRLPPLAQIDDMYVLAPITTN